MPVKISQEMVPAFCAISDAGMCAPITSRGIGDHGNIDHDLVHRHAAEHWATLTADPDIRALTGKMARVAIAIANADRGDTGRLGGHELPTIGNPVSGGQRAQQGDAGLEGHHVGQLLLTGGEGRNTVKHQPRPGKIAGTAWIIEQTRAVEQMPPFETLRTTERFQNFMKRGDLRAGEIRVFIGRWQM